MRKSHKNWKTEENTKKEKKIQKPLSKLNNPSKHGVTFQFLDPQNTLLVFGFEYFDVFWHIQ